MLNKSGEMGILIPVLERKFRAFLLNMISAVGLSYVTCIMFWHVPFIPTLLRVYCK